MLFPIPLCVAVVLVTGVCEVVLSLCRSSPLSVYADAFVDLTLWCDFPSGI